MHAVGHALAIAGSMTWEITWALILGFTLSAVVQAVVLVLRQHHGFTGLPDRPQVGPFHGIVSGHLTGRRIGKRPPRDVDVARVIVGALETGTLLEINGQPDRLDLRDVHARAAKEAGLKLIVSSDAHEVRSQSYVELAVDDENRRVGFGR